MFEHKFFVPRYFVDYRDAIHEEFFGHSVFRNSKLVRNTVNFVLYHRSPLFYFPKDEDERLKFFSCFGIGPLVHAKGPYQHSDGRYANPLIAGLALLHELAHNLFPYPTSLGGCTTPKFSAAMAEVEYAASIYSEVVLQYKVEGLREALGDVFFAPMWYDRMLELGFVQMPDISMIHTWREDWFRDPEAYTPVWAPGASYAKLAKYMEGYAKNNAEYNEKRLQLLRHVKGFQVREYKCVHPVSYLDNLMNFQVTETDPATLQAEYETRQLEHMQLVYKLLAQDNAPRSFSEMLARTDDFDQLVIDIR